jgi:hypothetical protein
MSMKKDSDQPPKMGGAPYCQTNVEFADPDVQKKGFTQKTFARYGHKSKAL